MSKKSISNDTRPGKIDGPQISREKHDRNSNTGLGRLILLLWCVSAWLHSHLLSFFLSNFKLVPCMLHLPSSILHLLRCLLVFYIYIVPCKLHLLSFIFQPVSCILYLEYCTYFCTMTLASCTMTLLLSVLISELIWKLFICILCFYYSTV